jgi:hypothetical protein
MGSASQKQNRKPHSPNEEQLTAADGIAFIERSGRGHRAASSCGKARFRTGLTPCLLRLSQS